MAVLFIKRAMLAPCLVAETHMEHMKKKLIKPTLDFFKKRSKVELEQNKKSYLKNKAEKMVLPF